MRWALPVALLFGAVIALWLLIASGVDFNPQLHQFFAQVSVPEAFGRNVVNVVLVDFRALDTLGEIVVVTLSFLAAIALLQSVRAHSQRERAKTQAGGGA